MADVTIKKPCGNYYTPPTAIKEDVPGLTTKKGEYRADFYSGTAQTLVTAGLLTLDMLPGQPGRNVVSAAYRPIGGARVDGELWDEVPGYMTVTRGASGRVQLYLTVSREEQARRTHIREEASASERSTRQAAERAELDRRDRALETSIGTDIVERIREGRDAWRERALRETSHWIDFALKQVNGHDASCIRGMRLSDRDIESLDALARRMAMLVRNAEIVIDDEAQAQAEAALRNQSDAQPRRSASLRVAWSAGS